jgi:hypothetical protein
MEMLIKHQFPPIVKDYEINLHRDLDISIKRLHEKWLKALEAKRAEVLSLAAEKGGIEEQLSKVDEHGIGVAKSLEELFTVRDTPLYRQKRGQSGQNSRSNLH